MVNIQPRREPIRQSAKVAAGELALASINFPRTANHQEAQ